MSFEYAIAPALLLVAGINLMLAIVIFSRGFRNISHVLFGLIALSTCLWSFAIACFYLKLGVRLSIDWAVYTHIFALSIAFIFFIFSSIFPERLYERPWRVMLISAAPFITVVMLLIYTDKILGKTEGLKYELFFGYLFYAGILAAYFLGGYFLLWRQFLHTIVPERRAQVKYVLAGAILSSSLAMITDLILPKLGIYEYTWSGPIFTLILVFSIFYAILRLGLFDLKVIATEVFVGLLVLIYFSNIVLSSSLTTRIINTLVFAATVFFGILLIRSVSKEVAAREEIRILAKNLGESNWQLARTNEQLKVLDQRKSEFVSLVSHQLRTPITAIKGYASMLLEESYGNLPVGVVGPANKIFLSADRLAKMVTEFLDLSKIEQGTMAYTYSSVDVATMLSDLIVEFMPVADKKGLSIDLEIPDNESFVVVADDGKIRQILSNLIDNAIKYTPRGKVMVSIEKNNSSGTVLVKIKDSGIGLSQDDIHNLFGKFTRGSVGSKHNTDGSGLGLYVAKKMIEAQKGKIWVDSEGAGKGSTFVVELSGESNRE